MTSTEELSPELAGEFRRFADAQTATTRPWPGVETAIRRSHRRRVTLASAGLALVIAAGAGTASVLLDQQATVKDNGTASQHNLPTDSPDHPQNDTWTKLDRAGLTGPSGGSLGDDADFLQGLRVRVAELTKSAMSERAASSPDDVLVLWAGDIDGQRIAMAGYAVGGATGEFVVQTLTGKQRAPAGEMTLHDPDHADLMSMDGLDAGASATIVNPDAPDHGVVLVLAPGSKQVDLATSRSFLPSKNPIELWKHLSRQGSVWVGIANQKELDVNMFRIGDPVTDADLVTGDITGSQGLYPMPPLTAVAAPGTDLDAVDEGRLQLSSLLATSAEQPVLVGTNPSGDYPTTAILLRSPDDGYLVSFVVRSQKASISIGSVLGVGFPVPASPDDVMVALVVHTEKGNDYAPIGYAVLAPTSAVRVRVGDVTVPVQNRIAFLPFTKGIWNDETDTGYEVEALDPAGKVITSVYPEEASVSAESGS